MDGLRKIYRELKNNRRKKQRAELNSGETKKYPPINALYSDLKNKEEVPWIFECPSVILRNSASNGYTTYQNFFKKGVVNLKLRKKTGKRSIYLR